MRIARDLAIGLVVAAVAGLLVGYLAHALLGLWVALGVGVAMLAVIGILEQRKGAGAEASRQIQDFFDRARQEMRPRGMSEADFLAARPATQRAATAILEDAQVESSTATEPADPIMRRRTEIIVEQIGDNRQTRAESRDLIKRGFALRGEVRKPTIREMTQLAKELLDGSLRDRIDRWCNDSRGFIQAHVHSKIADLMSEDRESELLAEWTKDSVIGVIDSHLGVLKRVMDSTPPTRLG